MYCIKIHKKGKSNVAAICDKEIVGKKFEDEKACLDVSGGFYNGKVVSDKEAVELMKNADILNISGNDAVGLALKNMIIRKEDIIFIGKTAHAEVF